MRQIFSIVATVIVAASLVCSDESVKNSGTATSAAAITADDKSTMKVDENAENTVKTKRGIHIASGITYTVPSSSYSRYNPYARFPGIYKASFNPIASFNPHYVLTPGNAVVHSFSATYPRLYLPPKPVLRPAIPSPVLVPKPIVVPSIYANRYPVFVPKPSVIPRPIVPVSNVPQFSVQSTPHIHTASGPFAFPSNAQQPTFIGQNAWRPSLSSAPSAQPSPANTPSLTVLPPFNSVNGQLASSNLIQRPNNYYLPVEQLQQDVATRSAQIAQVGLTHENIIPEQYRFQPDLPAHLQQLRQAQEIQNFNNFFRAERENVAVPLSQQGYETASNDGRFDGISSYQVGLNARGLNAKK